MNARYILPNFQENGDHVSNFVLDTDTLIFILCGPPSCHMVSSPPPFCWEGGWGLGQNRFEKKILLLGEGSGERMGKFPVWGLNLGKSFTWEHE